MHKTVMAVLYQHATVRTVVRIAVCPSSFPAFQHHGIIVHTDAAAVDQHVFAHIDIDGIATRSLGILRCVRSIDGTPEILHPFATV